MKALRNRLLPFLGLALASSAVAQTYDYNLTSSGAWGAPSTWTPNGVPTTGDDIGMTAASNLSLNLDGNRGASLIDFNTANGVNIRGNNVSNTFTLTVGALNILGSGDLRIVNHTTNSNTIGGLVSFGTVTQSNGRFFIGGSSGLTGGYAATTTNLNGGLLVADFRGPVGGINVGNVSFDAAGSGTLNVLGNADSSGTLQVSSLSGGGANNYVQLSSVTSNVTLGSATVRLNNTTNTAVFDGVIRDNNATHKLSVLMAGTGTQTFNRANTYSGGTTINTGSLILTGTGTLGTGNITLTNGTWDLSGISAASYTLSSTQNLSGTGTIVATSKRLVVEGSLAPGNSPGQLTIEGGEFDISNATTLNFELGTLSDSILLTSNADLTIGTLNFSDFTFTAISGFGVGQYVLISGWNTLDGALGTVSGTISGLDASLALDGNSLVLNVIPEPQSLLLLGLGFCLILGKIRKLGRSRI